jgi:hypothetical protein
LTLRLALRLRPIDLADWLAFTNKPDPTTCSRQTEHFQPLWARNVPKFGIAHALALGLGPWLAAEVPSLVGAGMLPTGGR